CFLIDVLNVIDGDEIDLKLNDKLDPCLVVPTDSESSYIHLIMPLRS
ncbi:DNA polymerase III subunit beta, partial [Candidatus Saccharibacteria bacterium]|nr:DNA polymerase III subunit beta [Candidatus Saccharibacteria bacterium]